MDKHLKHSTVIYTVQYIEKNIDRTSDAQFADAMFSEIDLIKDICSEEANGIEPVFYCPNYVKLDNFNNETLLRLDNTSLQQTYTKRIQTV